MLSPDDEALAAGTRCTCTTTPARTCTARWWWDAADELLVPVVDSGAIVADGAARCSAVAAADRRTADVERLDPGVRRLVNPHTYHVSITDELFELRRRLLAELDPT